MGYIGRSPEYGNAVSQQITGTNSAGPYTLSYDTNTSGVVVSLDGVVQRNSVDFNIVGTALTFTSTVGTGIIINVVFTGLTLSFPTPSDGSVTDAKITAMAASKLTGTIADARFPATLPAASGVNLTALNATNLGSGTVPDARFPATLPAGSGVNLTALNASNLGSGTVPTARLGSGTASSSTFLRGDSTYAEAGGGAWTKINKTTASTSSSVAFTSGITSTYNTFVILISGTYTSSDAQILLDFSNDGGSSYEAGGVYEWSNRIWEADGGTNDSASTSGDAFQIAMNSTTDGNGSMTAQADSHYIYISRAATASQYTNASWWGIYMSTGNSPTTYFGGGVYHTGEAINAFRLSTSTSTTFVKGDFTLYGIEA